MRKLHQEPPLLTVIDERELQQREHDRLLGIDPETRLTPEERRRRREREQIQALMEGYADGLRD